MMMSPKFHIVTLFPETVQPWLTTSILGRACEGGLFTYDLVQLRNYALDKHKVVDDSAYGGGGGMVLKVEPLVQALESITQPLSEEEFEVIYFSPTGEPLSASLLEKFTRSLKPHYILICGHYEGVDQRFLDHWVDREISLGDFVLTGGELPAVAFVDALVRKIGGVVHDEGAREESFSLTDEKGQVLLEYPHYTRPSEFRGIKVPEVLLSGNHEAISEWRKAESLRRTKELRPDLIDNR